MTVLVCPCLCADRVLEGFCKARIAKPGVLTSRESSVVIGFPVLRVRLARDLHRLSNNGAAIRFCVRA